MSVYDVTYETLGHTHPVISTAAEMGENGPLKKGMQLKSDSLLTLSGINLEISLETHKIFHRGIHFETKTCSY